jgi:hypothetical protein
LTARTHSTGSRVNRRVQGTAAAGALRMRGRILCPLGVPPALADGVSLASDTHGGTRMGAHVVTRQANMGLRRRGPA